MYFSLKFNIWVQWKDIRLTFQNLRESHFKNEVSEEKIKKLWKPKLKFVNSQSKDTDKQILQYSPLSSTVMLSREGFSSEAPLSQWDEARVYNSNTTKILWKSVHFMSFTCDFAMFYFPFDHQICYIEVRENLFKILLPKIFKSVFS